MAETRLAVRSWRSSGEPNTKSVYLGESHKVQKTHKKEWFWDILREIFIPRFCFSRTELPRLRLWNGEKRFVLRKHSQLYYTCNQDWEVQWTHNKEVDKLWSFKKKNKISGSTLQFLNALSAKQYATLVHAKNRKDALVEMFCDINDFDFNAWCKIKLLRFPVALSLMNLGFYVYAKNVYNPSALVMKRLSLLKRK